MRKRWEGPLLYASVRSAKAQPSFGLAFSILLVATLLASNVFAQELSVRPTSARNNSPPTAYAVQAEPGSPQIDGRLDDTVWATTMVISDFVQTNPIDGAAPSERTEVRITYDQEALYIGARMFDSEPDKIVARLGRRDGFTPSDMFWLMIDSYHDHRTAFKFGVNPAAVRSDLVSSNDMGGGDRGWDPVWEVATSIDSLGWVAEIKIPFSQLRFSSAPEQVWGINFSRHIFRKSEAVRWSWAPNTERGYASLFGHLGGLRDIPAPRRLEILPYSVGKSDFTEGADPENPFNDGSAYNVTGGFDLKYGITSDLTLDATINPDFGQVEADPAVVNLSAFETYFDERRPFFVEGASIFQFGAGSGGHSFGAPQLFYSRRIGKRPFRSARTSNGYVDNPISTRIIGATKLSGQTGGWSIGILDAVAERTSARIQTSDGTRSAEPVEPLTNYGLLSLRRDMRGGASGVGFLATSVHRQLNDPLLEGIRSSAYTGGIDFFHRFGGNQFALTGTLSASHILGSSDAILAAQRSSARYFQRPDQDYVSLDPNATSMTGYAVSAQVGKVSGNWTYSSDFFAYSPGFEVNDAGFETQVDRVFHGFRVSRRWLSPGKVFRRFHTNLNWTQSWNFGGTSLRRAVRMGAGGQFLNYWNFNFGGSLFFKGMSDKATRGGPLMEALGGWAFNGFVGSDGRKPLSFAVFANTFKDSRGGWRANLGTEFDVRPTGALSLSISPHISRSRSNGFYVGRFDDEFADLTFGARYLFGELEQKSINTTIRMDLALTPDLSIQMYAQPFIASGDYDRFKELTAPGSYEFHEYGSGGESTLDFDESGNLYSVDPDGSGPAQAFSFRNPDFRFRSLRSNLVIRWEYSPGAALFLVWNRGQSGYSSDPSFSVFDELGNLFRDDQQNTFLIKVNYWLSQ